jgi:predicted RNA-binding Zn-ribbon protein involved in translation (DUF1610 family)
MMLNSIPLKCPNCGANLEITPEMETFACGYCGASQMVARSGGTVSLRLLTESIAKVQVGTDKTAAELAIRRLREDYATLEAEYNHLDKQRWSKEFAIRQPYTIIWLLISFSCFVFLFGTAFQAFASFLVWIGTSAGMIYLYIQQSNANKNLYVPAQEAISTQLQEILEQINENKKIIGY